MAGAPIPAAAMSTPPAIHKERAPFVFADGPAVGS
jgi:hypothetical protein